VPYYNKPTQEGLYRHFVEIAKSVGVPVVVYNIPGRTGIDLLPETLARICEAAMNVVATKEATGNVLRAQKLKVMLNGRLAILSGDDSLTLPMIAIGARGIVSVTSNLLPADVSLATRLALDGKMDEARRAHLALLPVHEAMFLEANPGPIKAALAARGEALLASSGFEMSDAVRAPLVPVTGATRTAITAALDEYVTGRAAAPVASAGADRGRGARA
jgi:4-hydroxy-tetrahydrodipicolinate synthase